MSGILQLDSISGSPQVQQRLEPPAQILMGRSRDCDVVVASPQASRQHAQLCWEADEKSWFLTDLGSRSGTTLNGQPIPAGRPCAIRKGDRIGLPDIVLQVRDAHDGSTIMESIRRIHVEGDISNNESIDFSPVELAEDLDGNRLATLLDFSRELHDATDENRLFGAILKGVKKGTSLENAAIVSRMDVDGGIEMHAAMGELASAGPERFSRTLLRSATDGVPGRYLASGGMVAESLERLPVQAAACAPLMTRDSTAACLYVDGTDATIPDEQLRGDMDFMIALAQLASVAMSNLARSDLERRFSEARNKLFEGTVRAMAAAIDAKDPYTRGHSDRVSWLSGELARAIGHDPQGIEVAKVCGQVHDVGKIGVPEAVLSKPGRLDDEEFDLIKQHPDIGYRILKDIPGMGELLGGVRHHHERWDGSGYPVGLKGESIPILGRLVAVVDAFDAMRSARAYREGRNSETVRAEIERCAGTHFDPEMAAAFLKIDLAHYDAMLAQTQESAQPPEGDA
ncbi:MAG: hypothetical protein CMJ40_08685 [Phycisphaerae bacterium]|nr:hypothetical protein [Phycisphaerae bacterium]